MATIDIGKLTFTHKGDYSGSTAYVLNDVVYYNGSAYIAKTSTTGNLPTSTAHWNQFSAGSGGIWNSGLSIGTAGQVVKVNSGASALEFGNVSSPIQQFNADISTTSATNSSSGSYIDGAPTISITPTATNNKIYVEWHLHVSNDSTTGQDNAFRFEIYRDSTLVYTSGTNFNYKYFSGTGTLEVRSPVIFGYLDTTYNTTNQITYKYKFKNPHNTRSVSVNSSNTGHVKIFEF